MGINPLTGLDEDDQYVGGGQPTLQVPNPDADVPGSVPATSDFPDLKSFNSYVDAKRKAQDDENKQYDTTGAIQGALASLGAAFQGKDSLGAVNTVMKQRADQRKEKSDALNNWIANKKSEIAMGYQDAKQKREDSKFAVDAAQKEREDDVDSTESKAADQLARAMGYKGPPMTATQWKSQGPLFEKKYQIVMNAQSRADAKEAAKQNKSDSDYDKLVQSKEKEAENFRSDEAAKRSAAKLSAIRSGRALLDQFKGHEDDMSPDQLALLAADRVTAVTGAAPTQEEIKHMMPSNLGTGWANFKSMFTGAPSPANSGGWAKEAYTDFDAQDKAARDIFKSRQAGVASNPRLKPADRDRISKMSVPPELNLPENEMVRVKAPDGTIRQIPKNQLQQALNSGGKLVDEMAGL